MAHRDLPRHPLVFTGGLIVLLGSSRPRGVEPGFANLLVALGLINIALGVVQLVVAMFLRRRREWARKAGIGLGVLGAAIGAYNVYSAVTSVGFARRWCFLSSASF